MAPATPPGEFWCLNDSGNPAEIFRVSSAGEVLQAVTVTGARNLDWEAMARDVQGQLLIADVGDNARRRPTYTIYRVPEPAAGQDHVSSTETLDFRYHDGRSRDCESMFLLDGHIYLVSKESSSATAVFRLTCAEQPGGAVDAMSADHDPAKSGPPPDRPMPQLWIAEFVAELPGMAMLTDAAYSPDRGELALLTYFGFAVAPVRTESNLHDLKPVIRPHLLGLAEALSYRGEKLVVTNEKGTIWEFPLEPR